MRTTSKNLIIYLSTFLLSFSPAQSRADGPLAYAAAIGVAIAVGGAVTGKVISDKMSSDTSETNDENNTQTDTGTCDTTEDEGGDEDSSTRSGTGISGNNPDPVFININQTRGSWHQTETSSAVYGSKIPSSISPQTNQAVKAATSKVPGVGVVYKTIRDKGDVLQTANRIRKIQFSKTRSSTIKITRKGAVNTVINVPVRIKASEIRAETVDIAGTNGNSSSKLSVLVNNVTKFEASVSVSQGQMPVFTTPPSNATKEEKNDFGSIKNIDTEIKVRMPKGKRSALVKLVFETEGLGRRL